MYIYIYVYIYVIRYDRTTKTKEKTCFNETYGHNQQTWDTRNI